MREENLGAVPEVEIPVVTAITEPTDKEVWEGLAYALHQLQAILGGPSGEDAIRDKWQGDPSLRKSFRQEAARLAGVLEDNGLSVKSSNRALLRKRLDFILTSPPRPAYSPDE